MSQPVGRRATLTDADLPDFFQAADAESLKGQTRYVRQTATQLIALALAAILGALPETTFSNAIDWPAIGSALAFLVALAAMLHAQRRRDDRLWYDGRAAAESTKTLAWRYSVGGRPFSVSIDSDQAALCFLEQLKSVAGIIRQVTVVPRAEPRGEITMGMDEIRGSNLGDRKHAYIQGRIKNQRDWYQRKAKATDEAAMWWGRGVIAAETVGGAAALLRAAGVFSVDLLGIASALGAGGVAWVQLRQYRNLSSAYSTACRELNNIVSRPISVLSEAEWADFVDESEEAISREHTLWTASRGVVF